MLGPQLVEAILVISRCDLDGNPLLFERSFQLNILGVRFRSGAWPTRIVGTGHHLGRRVGLLSTGRLAGPELFELRDGSNDIVVLFLSGGPQDRDCIGDVGDLGGESLVDESSMDSIQDLVCHLRVFPFNADDNGLSARLDVDPLLEHPDYRAQLVLLGHGPKDGLAHHIFGVREARTSTFPTVDEIDVFGDRNQVLLGEDGVFDATVGGIGRRRDRSRGLPRLGMTSLRCAMMRDSAT